MKMKNILLLSVGFGFLMAINAVSASCEAKHTPTPGASYDERPGSPLFFMKIADRIGRLLPKVVLCSIGSGVCYYYRDTIKTFLIGTLLDSSIYTQKKLSSLRAHIAAFDFNIFAQRSFKGHSDELHSMLIDKYPGALDVSLVRAYHVIKQDNERVATILLELDNMCNTINSSHKGEVLLQEYAQLRVLAEKMQMNLTDNIREIQVILLK